MNLQLLITQVTSSSNWDNRHVQWKGIHQMKELNFKKIGSRIRNRRLALGKTQEYLANYIDVDASHISNIEHGRCKVSLTALVGISNALHCSIDCFLADEYRDSTIPVNNEIIQKLYNCDSDTKEKLSGIIDVLNNK